MIMNSPLEGPLAATVYSLQASILLSGVKETKKLILTEVLVIDEYIS